MYICTYHHEHQYHHHHITVIIQIGTTVITKLSPKPRQALKARPWTSSPQPMRAPAMPREQRLGWGGGLQRASEFSIYTKIYIA